MSESKLNANIKRLLTLNTQRKALEKEEDAVKAFFKELAGKDDSSWEYKGVIVKVSHDTQVRLDADAVRLELGPKAKKFEKTLPITKVTVAKLEAEA